MSIRNGFWADYAQQRGITIYGTAKSLGINHATLYRFLRGDFMRLGREKRRALCAQWRTGWKRLRELILAQSALRTAPAEKAAPLGASRRPGRQAPGVKRGAARKHGRRGEKTAGGKRNERSSDLVP